jgi:hypothetical protein
MIHRTLVYEMVIWVKAVGWRCSTYSGGSASFMPEVGMANTLSSNDMDGSVREIARGSGGWSLHECN